MARICYFVHGRGRGHANRTLSVVDALGRAGHDVVVFAGGQARDLLYQLPEYRLIDPVLPGLVGARRLMGRLTEDLDALRKLDPALVISDGDLPSVLAARRLTLPVVAIGHDMVFAKCRLPDGLPRRHLASERLTSLAPTYLAQRWVAVHFMPIEPRDARTRVARPALRPELEGEVRDDGHVVTYFRDRNGQEVVEAVARTGVRVVAFGDSGLAVTGVKSHPFDGGLFAEQLRHCRAVIASAGSNLLAECVMLGKPVLAMHRPEDAEQTLNATLLERAGVGLGCPIGQLDSKRLVQFLGKAGSGAFKHVPLQTLLPDVATVSVETVSSLL